MGLGFTESKLDSNLYFKVEGGRPVMLLLYVDVLFLTTEDELIEDARRRVRNERPRDDALLLRHGVVVECTWDFS